MNSFYRTLQTGSSAAAIIIVIALMLFTGFAMTRLTKRLRLPSVTAYILAGILLGPYCLHLVPETIVSGMDFVADIALAFIAFGTGEFFRVEALRRNGGKVMAITVLEACMASLLVFLVTFFALGVELTFSVVLAALAAATAPASTLMTIRQTGAKGDFVDTLLQVVALDDVVGLIAYSVAISIALTAATGRFSVGSILRPVMMNAGVFLLGGAFGFLMKLLMPKGRSTDNRLIISVATLFAFCGVCALLDVSPLLGCMSMGAVYINITGDDKIFKQLNYFSPPIMLLFFVRSGVNFKLSALVDSSAAVGRTPLLVIGVLYFLVRIVGKYAGAFWGCSLVGKDKGVRNYLGLALIPQAGVAIGLAALGARTLGGETGSALETVILASSVLYELIGPPCAKLALYLSKSYSNDLDELVPQVSEKPQPNAVELLIEQIQAIQKELPKHESDVSPEERAFMEAAEEQYAMMGRRPYRRGGK